MPTCNIPQNDSCLCHKMESPALKLQLSDVLDDHRLQLVHLLAAGAAEQEDGPQLEEGAVGDREVSDAWWKACLEEGNELFLVWQMLYLVEVKC